MSEFLDLREAILTADDLPRELVPTPEWGPKVDGKVYARALSGDERDMWETFMVHHLDDKPTTGDTVLVRANTRGIRAHLVCMGACDEDGDAIFSDKDVVQLGLKSGAALDRLDDVIRDLSGIRKKGEVKNSPPGSDSSIDSPPSSDAPSESYSGESIAEN